MINKIKTFFKLFNTVISVLNKKETTGLFLSFCLSVFNTLLELFSITTIVYLLLVISGQNMSESKISKLYNEILPENSLIIASAVLMISVVFIKTIFQILFNLYNEKISQNIQNRINNSLFNKFINLKYELYLDESSSKYLRLLSQESIKLGNQLISPLISIINESILLFFVSTLIFFYDPFLGTSVFVSSVVLIFLFSKSISRKIRNLGFEITKNNNDRIKNISETFKSFDLIKMYNSQTLVIDRYENFTKRINSAGAHYNFLVKLPKNIFELFIFIFLFSLIVTLYYTNNNDLLISYLSVLAVSVYKVIPSLNKISSSLQTIQYFSTPFKEVVDLLEADQESPKIDSVKSFNNISYKNLYFSYNNSKQLFRSLNFTIQKNDYVGIYGPSGSGKSTLIKLLCGLLKPQQGEFIIDNTEISPKLIHNYFSYVPQDPFIMDENIIRNVTFNFEENKIDLERVINVLKQVNLFEIFKNKLNKPLGENGIKISGGQKQRVAIARALYNNKQIIILDESTSNLDNETEENILGLLKKINEIITIIFISHKKTSLVDCNKLYNINNNEIKKIK